MKGREMESERGKTDFFECKCVCEREGVCVREKECV